MSGLMHQILGIIIVPTNNEQTAANLPSPASKKLPERRETQVIYNNVRIYLNL